MHALTSCITKHRKKFVVPYILEWMECIAKEIHLNMYVNISICGIAKETPSQLKRIDLKEDTMDRTHCQPLGLGPLVPFLSFPKHLTNFSLL